MTDKGRLRLFRGLSAAGLLLWMAVIFWFSSQNGETSGSLSEGVLNWILSLFPISLDGPAVEFLHFLLRKGAHFTEYLILALLLMNVMGRWGETRPRRVLAAVIFSAIYAATDEWHQSFVAQRFMSLADVGIDTAGALAGSLIYQACAAIHNGKKA